MHLEELPQPERVETVSPDTLTTDGDNPNEQSDEMFGLLCENMRTKGWLGNHIIANTDGLIADGEHRWRAAQEIGLDEVPVKFYDIDDDERRLWRQELNKISGEHDTKRDALEYDQLLSAGKTEAVEALTDAADEDLDELLAEIRVETSTKPQYEYDPEHNVYFEDCVEGMQERLEDNSVDMVFTSPPYNVGKEATGDRESEAVVYEDERTPDEFQSFLSDVFTEVCRVVKPGGHIFINLDHVHSQSSSINPTWWVDDIVPLPLKSLIVWHKPHSTLYGHLTERGQYHTDWEPIYHFSESDEPLEKRASECSNVWRHKTAEKFAGLGDDYGEHPAPFPVELPEHAIETATTEGDVILDPFMGSGTTAVAAIQNNRDYVGFELDEEGAYKPIIERRIGEAKRQKEASVNTESN